jgi:restriction endonuclease S subunit
MTGSTVQGVTLAKFRTLEVALPSLERQRAFARVFRALAEHEEAASALRTLRAEELEIHLRPLILEEYP